MLTIHLRINDAVTGKPTPVRVRITGSDGLHFAPLGRAVDIPLGRNEAVGGHLGIGRERWSYIDGACEISLPAGVPLRVQAAKGPEYRSVDETLTLGPGQMALRFAIERCSDMRAGGWVSVDSRCHFIAPHDAILEAAAEGVDVVNLLATPQRFPSLDGTAYLTVPNLLAFSGQGLALDRDGHAVAVNTLNIHPILGKVALLHSHRPVFPLTFGGEETDDWGICDWCDQCHRKQGLTVWVDAFEPVGGIVGGEALVAAILGKIDALEVNPGRRKVPLLPWVYRLWNAGVMLPLVGGSGKDSNKVALGAMRTYVRVTTSGVWVEAVRAGHTFITGGPLLDFRVEGDRFHASGASPGTQGKLEVVSNGQVIAAAESLAKSELSVPVPAQGWIAARWSGPDGFAHTSPLVLGPSEREANAVAALRKLIDQTREWAEQHGRYENPKRREQFLARCAEARAKLELHA
jgi:hypothetical protein